MQELGLPGSSTLRRTRARRGALGFVVVTALSALSALSIGGCSWLVDSSAAQCRADGDCARFGASSCDLATQVCVPLSGDAGAGLADAGAPPPGPSCRYVSGCSPCDAGQPPGLANACSDTTCVPFDPSRVTHTGPDGGLRSLPAVSQ